MIQIAAQIRILVAVDAIDGRKGIDAIAQLCREKLNADPFSGYLFIFRTRRGTAIRVLQYDGQGSGWPQSACPRDVSNGGQPARKRHGRCERIRLSYCSLPAILKRKLRRRGGR
jgi:hypothetical protein